LIFLLFVIIIVVVVVILSVVYFWSQVSSLVYIIIVSSEVLYLYDVIFSDIFFIKKSGAKHVSKRFFALGDHRSHK
jgi:hypothetical protein